ncbi:MAG: hypothetical protein JWO12_3256 [Frankiales bacterium]|nr:hypothetical protein [Frankiales bacterium]
MSAPHVCTGTRLDPLESVATPGACALGYDAGSGQYHLNGKTEKAWAFSS